MFLIFQKYANFDMPIIDQIFLCMDKFSFLQIYLNLSKLYTKTF